MYVYKYSHVWICICIYTYTIIYHVHILTRKLRPIPFETRCSRQQHTATDCNAHLVVKYFSHSYGVATIMRLLKIIGLFCKRARWKRRYSAKETYNFKEPTTRSHPIHGFVNSSTDVSKDYFTLAHSKPHCNSVQYTNAATHCCLLQYIATHSNALHRTNPSIAQHHSTTHALCYTLQPTAF